MTESTDRHDKCKFADYVFNHQSLTRICDYKERHVLKKKECLGCGNFSSKTEATK